MKILAATPQNYGRTVYIAELTAEDLNALLMLSPYENVPCVRGEQSILVDRDKLVAGDEIVRDEMVNRQTQITTFLDNRKAIESSMSLLKASMTKLQNQLPK